ncbi:MAG: TetR/AcrR family transcriptional regulator [Rhodocyclaceae bacterium]|nr:MAG: TetR/AcrR family transcriptional regulator [Rhodocyclaceae bacterium]
MQQAQTRCSSEARQAEIVDAVLTLAAQRSPLLITTADIAKVMGLTQGAVFKHFPTKDAISLAVMAWVDTNLNAALEIAAQQAPDALAGLRAVFAAHVRFVVQHPGVPRLIFSELQQPNDTPVKVQVRNLLTRYRKLLMSLLTAADRAGQLGNSVSKPAAASLFIGTVQGLVMQAMVAGSCERMESEGEQALALYLRAIGVDQ